MKLSARISVFIPLLISFVLGSCQKQITLLEQEKSSSSALFQENWKTYSDSNDRESFSFSIQYPPDWTIDTQHDSLKFGEDGLMDFQGPCGYAHIGDFEKKEEKTVISGEQCDKITNYNH